jgi:hypothetical protein
LDELAESLTQEAVELAAVLLCRAADLALALAGIETGGLEPETFDLFGRRNIDIIIDGLGILETVVEQGGNLDPPALLLGLHFVFIADADVAGGLRGNTVKFHLPLVTGFGGFGPGLEEADGPKIFVEADFFFVGHIQVRRLWPEDKIKLN